ncbi:MAG: GDP-L-fucose synthase [Candidatus Paceibacterota bacterium]
MMNKDDKIYIAGHRGMVGSAILKKLTQEGYHNTLYRTSEELDLRDQKNVLDFFLEERPKVVIMAAAKVGGIMANDTYPYDFLHDNLIIQDNIIHSSHESDVSKLVFLGSSCIYPKFASQPLREDSLLTGELEPTNQWYAIAKIVGIKLCDSLRKQHGRNYFSLMPTNLYGPGDNFDLNTSHVLPAMIRKFHEAKIEKNQPVTLWGSGTPRREFLFVEDVADAVLFSLVNELDKNLYNIGTGKDITIAELAKLIQSITGHSGEIIWDTNKPDGTPRKLMDTTRMEKEGWTYSTELEDGITQTYQWFINNRNKIREVQF